MADPDSTSTSDRKLHCPHKPVSLSLPFLREGSNVLERKPPQTGEPPSPLPTKRTRTYSSTNSEYGSPYLAVCHVTFKCCIGEYVPMEGDEVTYKVCGLTNLSSGRKHELSAPSSHIQSPTEE
uniref:Uncharacterized protein n=1 Tax=Cyprinus carpio TaxID=7962 RepID=A0A8C1U198_CYPCA